MNININEVTVLTQYIDLPPSELRAGNFPDVCLESTVLPCVAHIVHRIVDPPQIWRYYCKPLRCFPEGMEPERIICLAFEDNYDPYGDASKDKVTLRVVPGNVANKYFKS